MNNSVALLRNCKHAYTLRASSHFHNMFPCLAKRWHASFQTPSIFRRPRKNLCCWIQSTSEMNDYPLTMEAIPPSTPLSSCTQLVLLHLNWVTSCIHHLDLVSSRVMPGAVSSSVSRWNRIPPWKQLYGFDFRKRDMISFGISMAPIFQFYQKCSFVLGSLSCTRVQPGYSYFVPKNYPDWVGHNCIFSDLHKRLQGSKQESTHEASHVSVTRKLF